MRLIAAPDFADACRELTFWWASGKWSMLGSCFPKHCLGPSSQPAMIAVESAPARFVAAMSRQDVWSIAGNDMLHNVCIHADARLEDIPAGGRVAARGLLIFLRGDRNDALERFLRSPLFSQE